MSPVCRNRLEAFVDQTIQFWEYLILHAGRGHLGDSFLPRFPFLGGVVPTVDYPQLLKSLVAAARFSDGPTLFCIYQTDETGTCEVREQMPDGHPASWPESYRCRQQAEESIYQLGKTRN